jgi:biotin synthase-like enzyme
MIAAVATRMAMFSTRAWKPLPMNLPVRQASYAASSTARQHASFADLVTKQAAAAPAIYCVQRPTIYFVSPRQTQPCRSNLILKPERFVSRQLSIAELESFPALDWCDIAPRISPAVRSSLEKILDTQDGNSISQSEAYSLAHAEGDDLLGLLAAADLLRAELCGNIVTYVVNRNINFTNICFVGCKFCAFSRGPREADTYFLEPEQVAEKADEAARLGATEVCIQGGLPHGLPSFYYRDILRAVKKAVPSMHIHAFSPMEIVYGVELTGMKLADYLSMLRENGLDTLPGTAAEILDDEVRYILSRNKLSTAQWVEVIRTAHRCGIRTTSTMMYGHVETPEHWVRQCFCYARFRVRPKGSPNLFLSVSCIRTHFCFIKVLPAADRLWPNI